MPSSTRSLTVTDVLAFWGAILSSIAFGWNLYRDLLDRGKLTVSAQLRRVAMGRDGKLYTFKDGIPIEGASEKLYVVVTVMNSGRRPVMFKGWGGKWHDGKSFNVVGVDLPKMLAEGTYHSELTDEIVEQIDNVKELYVWDAAGKNWKVSRKGLKMLKEEARRIKTS